MALVDEIVSHFIGDRKDRDGSVRPFVELILSTDQTLSAKEAATETYDKVRDTFSKQAWVAFVVKVKTKFYHAPYVPSDEPNLLLGEAANTFEGLLALSLVENGRPRVEDDSIYGWLDGDAYKHLKVEGCSIIEVTSVTEDEWSEFADTFSDNAEISGLTGDAKCACGQWAGKLRAEMDLGELITTISRRATKG